jgi:hypothetical protein
LRDELQSRVEQRDHDHRAEDRARHGPRRVTHFPTGHERGLNAGKHEEQQDAASRERHHVRRVLGDKILRFDSRQAERDQEHERDDLHDGDGRVDSRPALDAHDVDRCKHHVDHRQRQRAGDARRQRRHEAAEVRDQHRRDRGHRHRQQQPQQEARKETRERAECGFDVRIRAARQRDATARFGHAQHDETHRDGAEQVRQRRGGAELGGHVGRHAKNAAADRDVEDAGAQCERADGSRQSGIRDRL